MREQSQDFKGKERDLQVKRVLSSSPCLSCPFPKAFNIAVGMNDRAVDNAARYRIVRLKYLERSGQPGFQFSEIIRVLLCPPYDAFRCNLTAPSEIDIDVAVRSIVAAHTTSVEIDLQRVACGPFREYSRDRLTMIARLDSRAHRPLPTNIAAKATKVPRMPVIPG